MIFASYYLTLETERQKRIEKISRIVINFVSISFLLLYLNATFFYGRIVVLNDIEKFLTENFKFELFNTPIFEITLFLLGFAFANYMLKYFFFYEVKKHKKEKNKIINKYELLTIKFQNAFLSSNKTRQLLI